MKLNRKSRTLLDIALAASLFAFAACSDYLEDFQDKYDDGNAFAEISSDSDNGGDDSKNSSSSNDIDSDSEVSSSSVDNGTPSSSSIVYERCSGTVIYDASKDSLNSIFGYPFMADDASEMQASSKGIKAKLPFQKGFFSLALADLSNDKTRDIETWGGLCIEYSSDGQADFVLVNDSLEKVQGLLSNELPVTNGDKASFKWLWSENEKLQEKQVELGYSKEPLSINKVSRLHFDNYYLPKTTTITIFRITTINEVDLDVGSSSSVAESSSAKKSCDGTVIYEPNMSNKFGEGVRILKNDSPVEDETDGFVLEIETTYLLRFNAQDISDWGGLCIEYTTTNPFEFAVQNYSDSITQTMNQTIEPGKHAISEVPWDNGSWDLLAIDNHSQQIDHIPNTSAILNEASQIFIRPSTSTESYGNQAKIHKITTMKQVDLKINSFQDGLVAVEKCDGDHQIIYNAPETKNVSSWGTNFFSTFTPETNATYNSTKKVLSMSMTAPESYQMNMVGVNQAETKDWGGLCIEYEADHPLFWSVSLLQNIASNQNTWDMGSEATVVLPKTEGIKAYKISWKKFGELNNKSFAEIINAMQFHHDSFDEYHVADKSYNIEDYKPTMKLNIQKITSYN